MVVIATGFIPSSPLSNFDHGYVGKQQVAWKEYCAENWLKELLTSMGRSTGWHDITDKMLKTTVKHKTQHNLSINLKKNG